MSWHFLERWIEKANQHSTLIGKFWITFLIVCRMVIVATVGDRVYSDEQSEFKCNTLQPGCTNVCFNKFSPISHLRFWSFQIIFVSAPSIVFVIYSAHKTKLKKVGQRKTRSSDHVAESAEQLNKWSSIRDKPKFEQMKIEPAKHNNFSASHIDRKKFVSQANRLNLEKIPSDGRFQSVEVIPLSTVIKLSESCDQGSSINHGYNKQKDSSLNKLTPIIGSFKQDSNNDNVDYEEKSHKVKRTDQKTMKNSFMVKPNLDENSFKNLTKQQTELLIYPMNRNDEQSLHLTNNFVPTENAWPETAMHKLYKNTNVYSLYEMCNAMPISPPSYSVREDEDQCDQTKTDLNPYVSSNNFPYSQPTGNNGLATSRLKHRRRKSKKQSTKNDYAIKQYDKILVEHFHWYVLSVFVRLCFEIVFTYLQIKIFNFSVPELYKCEQWPCPNLVDCFISRPTEKTIFLWFMLVYSCLCVVLNLCEFIYLFYVFAHKQFMRFKVKHKLKKSGGLKHYFENKSSSAPLLLPKQKEQILDCGLDDTSSCSSMRQRELNFWNNCREVIAKYGHQVDPELKYEIENADLVRNKDFSTFLLDSENEKDGSIEDELVHLKYEEAENLNDADYDVIEQNQADENDDDNFGFV